VRLLNGKASRSDANMSALMKPGIEALYRAEHAVAVSAVVLGQDLALFKYCGHFNDQSPGKPCKSSSNWIRATSRWRGLRGYLTAVDWPAERYRPTKASRRRHGMLSRHWRKHREIRSTGDRHHRSGSQFLQRQTSPTRCSAGHLPSMDGKGARRDNVSVERN